MKIGFVYDLKTDYPTPPKRQPDLYAEFDSLKTIEYIESALKKTGNIVYKIGNCNNLIKLLDSGDFRNKVDIVFNIAEGLYGRGREAVVPALLEMYKIPYIGSDPLTMATALDKVTAKKIVLFHKIKTPEFAEVNTKSDLKKINLAYPMIVKLRYEGTSKGLDSSSLVNNDEQLKIRVDYIFKKYNEPVIVEEFVKGKEFTVAVIGNTPPVVLPPVQIAIHGNLNLGELFYIHALVTETGVNYICPAKVTKPVLKKICKLALESYFALECRDFSRIDIRTDEKDEPYFIECNPLPSLAAIDIWPIVAKQMGLSYNKIIAKIINYGVSRLRRSEKG